MDFLTDHRAVTPHGVLWVAARLRRLLSWLPRRFLLYVLRIFVRLFILYTHGLIKQAMIYLYITFFLFVHKTKFLVHCLPSFQSAQWTITRAS